MIYLFDGHALDTERRELRRGAALVAIEPQVFDLLRLLIEQRARVLGKDDLLAAVWKGRIVSESTLTSRMAFLRRAIGDSGEQQRLVRTVARNGYRFVGAVREQPSLEDAAGSSAEAPAAAPRAERRQLTIIACALDAALDLASRLDPETLRELMADCFGRLERVIALHHGVVAGRTGDGVLGCFGYPQAHEADAENAIRAGLAAIEAVAALAPRVAGRPLALRVGIATGLVVVGDSAADGCSVVGETPHLATRLAGAGAPGAPTVSAATRRLVGGLFEWRELGSTADALAAWQVIGGAAANRFAALHPMRGPLIGRDEELELLSRRWQQARNGDGRVMLISGEPGIGKSHLAAAFEEALAGAPHACLRYFCAPHRRHAALHPVIAQIEEAAGFAPGDDDAARLDKLTRSLARCGGAGDTERALFAELLGIAAGSERLALSAPRRKELLLEAFIAQIAALAARSPVLVVLEDAHWLDSTTREWFDVLVERVAALRVLLVVTFRPEFDAPWLGPPHVAAWTLGRLERGHNLSLIRRVAGGKALPAPLVEQIVARTDGVPLFVEEVTRSVLESGLLRETDAGYVIDGPLPVLAVPATLQASLNARLDRLDAARTLVQTCAALGREFGYAALKEVAALSDAQLQPLLEQLVASGLVQPRGAGRYAFKHALVQNAAYETLLTSQRTALHGRIVGVLEQRFAELPERHPDVLAHHCRAAGLGEKAIDYAIRAARMALERSAGVEARALVEAALPLLDGLASAASRRRLEGRLRIAEADALTMTEGFASPRVMSALSLARDALDEAEQPMESVRALCGLFNYHLMRSESPACLALSGSWLERALDRPTACVVHYLVGTSHLHLGRFGDSIRHLEAALSSYDEAACRDVAFVAGYHLRSFTLIWLGLAYLYVGAAERAARTMSAAVQDARGRAHPFTLVSALLALARFRSHVHDLAGAVEAVDEGRAIAVEQRSPYHVSRADVLRASNLVDAGRCDEGIELMERALAAHRATGANFQSSYNLSRLAEAHARAGRIERALQLAEEALADVARTGERWWEAEAWRLLGGIHRLVGAGGEAEAERCLRRALACARAQRAQLWEQRAAQSLGELWRAQGRQREAQALLVSVEANP